MTILKAAITNLGKYNEGQLIYKWINLPISQEDLKVALEDIGINSEYEEYFFSDYDGDYNVEVLSLGEYESIDRLNEIAEAIEAYEDKFLAVAEVNGTNFALENDLDNFYLYGVDTFKELAELFVDEGLYGEIPTLLANYIDYEAIGIDLSFDNYYETDYGIVYID